MCQLLGVKRSGYYAWCQRPASSRVKANQQLIKQIRQFHRQYQSYGSPRITNELHKAGIRCGHNRVARLMRENGIKAVIPRRFKTTTNSKHHYPVAENLLNQCFETERPNQVWVADITYIWTLQGWLYLAAVMDLYSRQIVGWAMDKTMTQDLVIQALNQAIGRRRPPRGLIHHSDRGCQYASTKYQKLLKKNGMRASMSRKGNCYDNACMESFFHSLKTECVYLRSYRTRQEAKQSIFQYIEVFYNRIRSHSSLNYMSPYYYEKMSLVA
jgi:putative transposase